MQADVTGSARFKSLQCEGGPAVHKPLVFGVIIAPATAALGDFRTFQERIADRYQDLFLQSICPVASPVSYGAPPGTLPSRVK